MLASSLLLPSPYAVFERLIHHFPQFLFHLSATLLEMILGMGLAALIAFPLGYLMARFKTVGVTLQPIFLLLKCLPMFALAPIMLLFFGWSIISIVIPTALMIIFPLTINIYRGLMTTKRSYLEYFNVHGATSWQTFWKLKFPFALPYIFSGLRISAGLAAMGAIAGEWAGAQRGLGIYLQECRFQFDLEGVFATLFCLLMMSTLFYGGFILIEKAVTRRKYDT